MKPRPVKFEEAPAPEPERGARVLGRVVGAEPGPTLVCIAGLHGNEPAGVEALKRVFSRLSEESPGLRGEFLGLAGNLTALARGRRYMERDLNRGWFAARLTTRSKRAGELNLSEDREAAELLAELHAAFDRARGEVFIIDLHTTSGEGIPFLMMGDTLRNRRFALRFPIPLVLGMEEQLDGTLLDYLANHGYITLCLEAGRHDAPEAVEQAEAAIWIALVSAGLTEEADLPRARSARSLLADRVKDMPRVFEVRYRHPVFPNDSFRMEPGFGNFQSIRPGQLLARNGTQEIRSRWQARLLMPLYQEQGEDGFFIVREFAPFWLNVSALLRRLGFTRIVHWLPGVRRHPDRPETLVVDRKLARFFALEVLHLLGYRKHRSVGGVLLVSRRHHDLK